MTKHKRGQFARLECKSTGTRVDPVAQFGNNFARTDAIARRSYEALSARQMRNEVAPAPVGQNEIGIEEYEPLIGHTWPEVGESAVQCISEGHAVLVRCHNKIIQADETHRAQLANARHYWSIQDSFKENLLGNADDHARAAK